MAAFRWCVVSGLGGASLPDERPRYAVYYAPETDDPLWEAGCAWLGRDPTSAEEIGPQDFPERTSYVAAARRYGLHATIKAPMALKGSLGNFVIDVAAVALSFKAFELPRLSIADDLGFVALRPLETSGPLAQLSATCVEALDSHRLPEDEHKVDKRAAGLSERQQFLLRRWGYPYVMDQWHFHMTLANGHLPPDLLANLKARLTAPLASTRSVSSLCIFGEGHRGASFRLLHRLPLGRAA